MKSERFIQKEREKYVYYERTYSEDGEQTEQIRVQFKIDMFIFKDQERIINMVDGDRVNIDDNEEVR